MVERNTSKRKIQLNQIFGKLKIIGNAGLKDYYGNKRRNFSICKCECGNTIEVSDNSLLSGHRVSCGCIVSKGEFLIEQLLIKHNIIYTKDAIFPELLKQTGRRLRFDFIIYNSNGSINRFIEFDGNQHKKGMDGGVWSHIETLKVIQERDKIKNDFCIKNNYILIRLPYSLINNITIKKIMGDTYKVSKGDDFSD